MITLYQFGSLWGLPNVSPFCLKLEAYLRLSAIPYKVRAVNNPMRSPKGKLPFIKDDEKVIADSDLIILYLKEKYGDPLDQHLSRQRQAQALAWQRLLEEHLYWVILYSRWVDESNWPTLKKAFFDPVPLLVRPFVASSVRKNMKRELNGQGLGRHNRDEIYQLGINDLRALEAVLTEQPYLAGDVVTSIDAVGFAFLANIIDVPVESPLKEYALGVPAFRRYCDEVRKKCLF